MTDPISPEASALAALITIDQQLRSLPIDELYKKYTADIAEVVVHHSEGIVDGSVDITNNRVQLALIIAAKKWLSSSGPIRELLHGQDQEAGEIPEDFEDSLDGCEASDTEDLEEGTTVLPETETGGEPAENSSVDPSGRGRSGNFSVGVQPRISVED